MNRACKNYTLVEILVTLAIVGILLGISLPAYQKIFKGNAVDAVARNIGSSLTLARSKAITSRNYVAVLFPDDESSDWVNFKTYKQPFRMIRMCYVTKDSSASPTTYEFKSWVPGNEWIIFPETTSAYITTGHSSSPPTPPAPPLVKKVQIPDKSNPSTTVEFDIKAVIFNPYGSIEYSGGDSIIIRALEAVYQQTSANAPPLEPNLSTDNKLDYEIFKFTGSYEVQ
ncbi:MAG: GspH/FimT family pseudopilin [Victivallales bacterium]|jgi:prepilin-type N-terminal cleavage/methylation domain-containing protein|nr:GspH/FimT family pseudopilin [Victivallales bacterium]